MGMDSTDMELIRAMMEVRAGVFDKLMQELEKIPPSLLPPDERRDAAYAWAIGGAQRGHKTVEEILNDRALKALVLDDFDDEAADERLRIAMVGFGSGKRGIPTPDGPSPEVGRNDPCPCGSGKKYKKCCLD